MGLAWTFILFCILLSGRGAFAEDATDIDVHGGGIDIDRDLSILLKDQIEVSTRLQSTIHEHNANMATQGPLDRGGTAHQPLRRLQQAAISPLSGDDAAAPAISLPWR